MSWISGPCEPDDERPVTVVICRQDGPNGEPGELIWVDTGSGPGREIWMPSSSGTVEQGEH